MRSLSSADLSSPVFRAATADDTAAIERLLTDAGLPTVGVTQLLAADARQFVVVEESERAPSLVAVAGLEVRGDNALLRSVAVRADWQRHRLGHQLVQRVLDEAESRGIRSLYLLTTTAEGFFPRFGFDVIPRDRVPVEIANTLEFRSACPASATAMSRTLVTS